LVVVGAAGFAAGAADTPPAGAALVQRACTGCHGIETIAAQGRTAQDWSDMVDNMASYGVDATPAELAQIKAYLAKTYPAAH
jgi:cytochrome c5